LKLTNDSIDEFNIKLVLVCKRRSNIISLQFHKVILQSLRMCIINTGAVAREVLHKLMGDCGVINAPIDLITLERVLNLDR